MKYAKWWNGRETAVARSMVCDAAPTHNHRNTYFKLIGCEHEVCMFVIRCSFPCTYIFRFRSKIHAKIIRRHLFQNEMAHQCHLPSPCPADLEPLNFLIRRVNARDLASSISFIYFIFYFYFLSLCVCVCVPRLVHLNYSYSLHKFKFTFYEIARAHLCRVQKKSNESSDEASLKEEKSKLFRSLLLPSHCIVPPSSTRPPSVPILYMAVYMYR